MFRNCAFALVLLAAALGGCQRSISNSGYNEDGYYGRSAFYQGEIDELDLFVPRERQATLESDITKALADATRVTAQLGKPLLVVQSGALVPDELMTDALETHFQVSPFSGVPSQPAYPNVQTVSTAEPGSFGERLRLAAAQGGYRRVLVYWGQLESLRTRGVTKAVSWVPIVGMVIPAIIDVETGRWRMILPESVADSAISASINRATSDQEQVQHLKAAGYAKLADMIIAEAGAAQTN
jgi:hypothetical protein